MSLELLQAKSELRDLVDAYTNLGDEKKISEQMLLYATDGRYTVKMGGQVVSDVRGRKQLEKEFNGHVALVKRYFSINGQHNVEVDGDTASGVSYSHLRMLRAGENEGDSDVITDYSVIYKDTYIRENGTWLINTRVADFTFIESKPYKG